MFITFFDNATSSDKKTPLDDNDAADANRRYSPNGTNQPNFDPNADPNRPYKGKNFGVHRGNKGIDHRTVNDNGKGWAIPRPGLPYGVDPEEWLDLWRKGGKGEPEWDIVEQEVADDCPCPNGWSGQNPPPEPSNKKKYDEAMKQKAIDDEKKADERWRQRNPNK